MDKLPILFSTLQRLLLIYCAFYLGFHCVIRFPSIAPYLVFHCVFSLSFSCVFWKGGGIFRVFLFSASSVCFNVPFVVVLLHPLWYYWFHCFSFNCAFCPLSSICLSSASIVYPSTANYVFKIFLFCFFNFIKTVIPFTTLAFAFKSTVKNVNTFTMFISNLLMSLIAHAKNSLW